MHLSVIRILRLRSASVVGFRFLLDLGLHVAESMPTPLPSDRTDNTWIILIGSDERAEWTRSRRAYREVPWR